MGNDNRDAAPRAPRVDCLRQGGVARFTGVLFTQEHIFDASATLAVNGIASPLDGKEGDFDEPTIRLMAHSRHGLTTGP